MKRSYVSVLVFLVVYSISHAVGIGAAGEPVVLEPYQVEERPFGFLGIKHATVSLSPLKLIVGMNAVKFLQIDELEAESPGTAAGVLPGDRIVNIDGVAITKMGLRKLKRMNRELEVGQKLRVEVLRPSDGSIRVIDVTVPPRAKKPQLSVELSRSGQLGAG